MTGPESFLNDVRKNVDAQGRQSVQALSDEVSQEVLNLVRATLPRALASNAMSNLETVGETSWDCTGAKFTCGEYQCVGVVGCSGEFSCTVKFFG